MDHPFASRFGMDYAVPGVLGGLGQGYSQPNLMYSFEGNQFGNFTPITSFGKKKRNTSIRTRPALWKKVVKEIKNGSKGGAAGQWSARKAQLAVKIYKQRGGSYKGKKSKNNDLDKWTKQKWRTKSGKNSTVGRKATGERYLPSKAIKNLSKTEYKKTTRAKRKGIKKGKQYVKQPKKIAKKTKKYR